MLPNQIFKFWVCDGLGSCLFGGEEERKDGGVWGLNLKS